MSTRIGIDMGGTYTDAVLIRSGRIAKTGKVLTRKDQLLDTVLEALDALNIQETEDIGNITVSTTLVTNAILQKRLAPVELILLPGSGIKPESLSWPVPYRVLKGELDYRGSEVASLDEGELLRLAEEMKASIRLKKLAVVSGKFAHRNHIMEQRLAAFLRREIPELTVAPGSEWGQINFYRRSLTAYLNLAVQNLFADFLEGLIQAIGARGLQAPVRILKADGGMLPAGKIRPVESIYSGPVASVLGSLAQSGPKESFIVVDIGGTTTDIGLVLSGKPLSSVKGARIGEFLTNVNSLAVQSVSVGGDSAVLADSDGLKLAGYRLGPAFCLGGNHPTPTDAMRYLDLIDYGGFREAEKAMVLLSPEYRREKQDLKVVAETIVDSMAEKIAAAIERLVTQWKTEPAYKVWQVLHPHTKEQFPIRLSGGGAAGIAKALADRLKTSAELTGHAVVANAVGAAMAKPTFSWTLNLDTSLRRYRIEETGEQGKWQGELKPHRQAERFLLDLAREQARDTGIADFEPEIEPFDYFPLIEGYRSVGQIVRGRVYLPPGAVQVYDEGGG